MFAQSSQIDGLFLLAERNAWKDQALKLLRSYYNMCQENKKLREEKSDLEQLGKDLMEYVSNDIADEKLYGMCLKLLGNSDGRQVH